MLLTLLVLVAAPFIAAAVSGYLAGRFLSGWAILAGAIAIPLAFAAFLMPAIGGGILVLVAMI
jgi:hypothetical protein